VILFSLVVWCHWLRGPSAVSSWRWGRLCNANTEPAADTDRMWHQHIGEHNAASKYQESQLVHLKVSYKKIFDSLILLGPGGLPGNTQMCHFSGTPCVGCPAPVPRGLFGSGCVCVWRCWLGIKPVQYCYSNPCSPGYLGQLWGNLPNPWWLWKLILLLQKPSVHK